MGDMDRPGGPRTALDPQTHATRHESRIELVSRIAVVRTLCRLSFETLEVNSEQINDCDTGIAWTFAIPFRRVAAVDNSTASARVHAVQHGWTTGRPLLRGPIGCRRPGANGLASQHQRPQISVFPFFDAPVRQAAQFETLNCVLAQRLDRSVARQRTARCARSRLVTQSLLSRCLDGGGADFGVAHRFRPPRRNIAHSPWLRARARAPCRRSSPPCPWPSRAPRRARCSRAAAGNA